MYISNSRSVKRIVTNWLTLVFSVFYNNANANVGESGTDYYYKRGVDTYTRYTR